MNQPELRHQTATSGSPSLPRYPHQHPHPRLSLSPLPSRIPSRPLLYSWFSDSPRPSYLRLAGRLFVPAVGTGPGARVVPQCVAFDGQVHRGLRKCRLRAPGLSVAKSGSSSSGSGNSIRLSPRVGGAYWLQMACRCDRRPRRQRQRQGPPPLLRSYPGDLKPSPSPSRSLLHLLLGMRGRTRLLFPFQIQQTCRGRERGNKGERREMMRMNSVYLCTMGI